MARLAVAVIVIGLFVGGYFYLERGDKQATYEAEMSEFAFPENMAPGDEVPDGFKVYTNSEYSFSLLYPETMKVSQVDDGGGAMTIVFEDTQNVLGFQIFIVPHTSPEVGPDRFLQDVPSGVKKHEKSLELDGVLATSFYTEHIGYGETYEIWSIYNSYLYEINTLKPLSGFLDGIIKTWQFH